MCSKSKTNSNKIRFIMTKKNGAKDISEIYIMNI